MDASIARRADTELLYDQPYEDNKRVRVTGPFTVESLSPHRMLSTDEDRPKTEQEGQTQGAASGGFETLILDNLRVAGVENTKKGERLSSPAGTVCRHLAACSGRISGKGRNHKAGGSVHWS